MGAKVTGYKLKPPEASEGVIRAAIRKYLSLKGWYVVLHYNGPLSHAGFPDLTAYKNGLCIMIECKKKTGKLSKDQKEFQENMKQKGMLYLVGRSVDDIVNAIDRICLVVPDVDGQTSIVITPAKGMRVEVVE